MKHHKHSRYSKKQTQKAKTAHGKRQEQRYRRFAQLFALTFDATQAYIDAGFKPRNKKAAWGNASRLLRHDKVQRFLREATQHIEKQLDEQYEITETRILDELANVAFSKIDDYLRFGPKGVTLKSSDGLTARQLAAVEGASEAKATGSIKLKLYNKLDALTRLAQIRGMLEPEDEEGKRVKTVINVYCPPFADGNSAESARSGAPHTKR